MKYNNMMKLLDRFSVALGIGLIALAVFMTGDQMGIARGKTLADPPPKPITRTVIHYRPLESVLFVADKVCAKHGLWSDVDEYRYTPGDPEVVCMDGAVFNMQGELIAPGLVK